MDEAKQRLAPLWQQPTDPYLRTICDIARIPDKEQKEAACTMLRLEQTNAHRLCQDVLALC